ncbi:MAG: magnesium chelatase [Clostridiales bacterium]|jgi:magnesium chelatase subunit I|nr:magnesium chelatase [Clostridiales bacterium]
MHWNDVILHQGNEELQRFIEIGLLAARLGVPIHFHVEGERGTGKTTLIRAARSRLPQMERVYGCLYNCEPNRPHCPDHKDKVGLSQEKTLVPFLEVSHSAKIGTVVGSIDLDRLTSKTRPAAALLPGTLPRANRGIIFVDEINRLADTSPALVDVLLDAMGTKPGRVQIEETGLPTVEMPVTVNVWAASNPDEEPGPLQEIRRQLADRFDFAVRIQRPDRPEVVRAIINAETDLPQSMRITQMPLGQGILDSLTLDPRVEEFLGEAYIRFRLESIRGIQAARLGALLHAILHGKTVADFSDLAVVLPAALRHRIEAPKLLEVAEAMKKATESEKRIEKNSPPANPIGPVRKTSGGYPAFWRGLWQRLSSQKTGHSGKSLTAENATPTQGGGESSEKKKTAVLTGPAETE